MDKKTNPSECCITFPTGHFPTRPAVPLCRCVSQLKLANMQFTACDFGNGMRCVWAGGPKNFYSSHNWDGIANVKEGLCKESRLCSNQYRSVGLRRVAWRWGKKRGSNWATRQCLTDSWSLNTPHPVSNYRDQVFSNISLALDSTGQLQNASGNTTHGWDR